MMSSWKPPLFKTTSKMNGLEDNGGAPHFNESEFQKLESEGKKKQFELFAEILKINLVFAIMRKSVTSGLSVSSRKPGTCSAGFQIRMDQAIT
ncbi:hypothetical protein TNIN_295851 [Trichonephila inaurata madagascariensis]|uniref:Uncharacterized protein n=1 Tax=Trichonephila inaurata madagascariensis TaxID=2747483 RepID=A0A8X6Y774_9ARAC|nr:hypothetical protein TNIN_295851 [Trichonephila inaurata madagascariensis]